MDLLLPLFAAGTREGFVGMQLIEYRQTKALCLLISGASLQLTNTISPTVAKGKRFSLQLQTALGQIPTPGVLPARHGAAPSRKTSGFSQGALRAEPPCRGQGAGGKPNSRLEGWGRKGFLQEASTTSRCLTLCCVGWKT